MGQVDIQAVDARAGQLTNAHFAQAAIAAVPASLRRRSASTSSLADLNHYVARGLEPKVPWASADEKDVSSLEFNQEVAIHVHACAPAG